MNIHRELIVQPNLIKLLTTQQLPGGRGEGGVGEGCGRPLAICRIPQNIQLSRIHNNTHTLQVLLHLIWQQLKQDLRKSVTHSK